MRRVQNAGMPCPTAVRWRRLWGLQVACGVVLLAVAVVVPILERHEVMALRIAWAVVYVTVGCLQVAQGLVARRSTQPPINRWR